MGTKSVYFTPSLQKHVETLAKKGHGVSYVIGHILLRYEALMRSVDAEMNSYFSPDELDFLLKALNGYKPPLDLNVYMSLKQVILRMLELNGAPSDLLRKLDKLDLLRVIWLFDHFERTSG
ncbi:MAG: hypothetical protein QXI60_06560 [Thermofilaceae archaeon]